LRTPAIYSRTSAGRDAASLLPGQGAAGLAVRSIYGARRIATFRTKVSECPAVNSSGHLIPAATSLSKAKVLDAYL